MSAGLEFTRLAEACPHAKGLVDAAKVLHRRTAKALRKEAEASKILEKALIDVARVAPQVRGTVSSALEMASRKREEAQKGRIP